MRLLPRLVVLAGLLYLCIILFREGKRLEAVGTHDPSHLFLIFGGALLAAIAGGIIIAVTALPVLGEKIGQLIYGAPDDSAHDPFFLAHSMIEDGDYVEAISFYRQALAADPDDTAAIEGIADVQTKYLGETAVAIEGLELQLQKHWPPDEEAFLKCKLAEIHARYEQNMPRARELLVEVIEAYPDTVASRNALHLLEELERGV